VFWVMVQLVKVGELLVQEMPPPPPLLPEMVQLVKVGELLVQ
jgi:hypothetical protein